jgi:hypothetical protein
VRTVLFILLVLGAGAFEAAAQLQWLPADATPRVFAGGERALGLRIRNPGGETVEADIRAIISQTSAATAVRIGEVPWKRLQVLPGQTIVDSVPVTFPAVRAETRFLIQWVEGASNVLGRTEVLVYPTNLLQELKALAGDSENALGLFDPDDQLKPLLKGLGVEFSDLEEDGLDGFRGKLAIVGPFAARARMREGLPEQIEKLARKGVAVVWLQPPPDRRAKLQPSFYCVPTGDGAVVVAQAELVTNLSANPQSQLNLIHCARLARHPEPPRLPHLDSQP